MNKYVGALSILYLSLSLFIYQSIPTDEAHKDVDTHEYEVIAHEFAASNRLVWPQHPTQMPSHTLGYHFFLGIITKLFGFSIPIIVFMQVILGLMSCLLLYASALRLFNQMVASIVLLLAVTNFGFLIYPNIIYAEMLMLFFFICFLYTFICFVHEQKLWQLCASACMLGISVIVKPVGIFFIAPLTIFSLWALKAPSRKKLIYGLFCFFSFSVPLFGYMVHNKIMFDTLSVTGLIGENLYSYFLPNKILPELHEHERTYCEHAIAHAEDRMRMRKEIFWNLFMCHPFLFCKAWLSCMVKIFFGLTTTQLKVSFDASLRGGPASFFCQKGTSFFEKLSHYIHGGSPHVVISLLGWIEVMRLLLNYFFFLLGIIMLIYFREYFWSLFFVCYIGYFSFVAGHDGSGRYRMMLEPILILGIAYGIYIVYCRICSKKCLQGNIVPLV